MRDDRQRELLGNQNSAPIYIYIYDPPKNRKHFPHLTLSASFPPPLSFSRPLPSACPAGPLGLSLLFIGVRDYRINCL